jgi:hypothetical protein
MFDEILKMVKDHLGNNQEVSSAIPADQQDAVHHEVATQMTNALKNQASAQGGGGGLLSMLQDSLTSGSRCSCDRRWIGRWFIGKVWSICDYCWSYNRCIAGIITKICTQSKRSERHQYN